MNVNTAEIFESLLFVTNGKYRKFPFKKYRKYYDKIKEYSKLLNLNEIDYMYLSLKARKREFYLTPPHLVSIHNTKVLKNYIDRMEKKLKDLNSILLTSQLSRTNERAELVLKRLHDDISDNQYFNLFCNAQNDLLLMLFLYDTLLHKDLLTKFEQRYIDDTEKFLGTKRDSFLYKKNMCLFRLLNNIVKGKNV